MTAAELWQLFARTYLDAGQPVRYVEHHLFEHGAAQGIRLVVEKDGMTHLLSGEGNGPIDAAVHALRGIGIDLQVRSFEERSTQASAAAGDAQACAFIELRQSGGERFGVGLDANIITASIKALVSGVNRIAAEAAMAATMAA